MDVHRVEVVGDQACFTRTSVGTISGRIWLQFDDGDERLEFPERGWSDLPVALLAGWLADLAPLAAGTRGETTCHFLDGPMQVDTAVRPDGRWRLRCKSIHVGPLEWFPDGATFYASVRDAARAALAECDRRGWSGRDTDALRHALGPPESRPAS